MAEFVFVLKCFCITAILIVFMQLKVGNHSIEAYTFHWLRRSTASQYIQSVAAGGAMAIRNLGGTVKEAAADTVSSFKQGASEQAQR